MAKIAQRIKNSYDAYLRYRQIWSDKGYGLDRKLTLSEYAKVHYSLSHSREQHIARKVAANERTWTRSEGAAIARRIKNIDKYKNIDPDAIKKLRKKYKRGRDVYGAQLTPEEEQAQEMHRREALIKRGKQPQYTIQANARIKLFEELRAAGLSYKEAAEVIDS